MALPPIPLKELESLPFTVQEWLRNLQLLVGGSTGTIPWANINTAGSNLTNIATRLHSALQSLQGGTVGEYYHLTLAEITNLRKIGVQGSNIASATDIVIPADGTYFQITGTTAIDHIASTNVQGGTQVTLKFNSNPVVRNNQAASGVNKPIILNGAVNFSTAANNTLSLVYDSTDAVWYETSRKV